MVALFSDLDNTLIYSYKREIGHQKKCVEIYQNREISYMTLNSYSMLEKLRQNILFVPTTTRTLEQYERIHLGKEPEDYALVCNGGILLEKGVPSKQWYSKSLSLIQNSRRELDISIQLLETEENRSFEIRFLDELFVFTKSDAPEKTVEYLASHLDTTKVDIFHNGIKIYVVPKALSKGMAVKRLKEKLSIEKAFAAGDSEFDCSMLKLADQAFLPMQLKAETQETFPNEVIGNSKSVFSDQFLSYILKNTNGLLKTPAIY